MEKSTFSPLYEEFRKQLVELRKRAGLSQRALAAILGRERSFVARVEQGERRLDVVEFYWLCQALGSDPAETAGRVMESLAEMEPPGSSERGGGA